MEPAQAESPEATQLPRSSWQIDVLAQADRLEADLASVRNDAPQAVEAIQGHIAKARDMAHGKPKRPNPVLDWISGLSVEAAWRELQRAQEDMLALRAPKELVGEAHYFDALAAQHPDPDLQKVTRSWVDRTTAVDPAVAKLILAPRSRRDEHCTPVNPATPQPDPRMVRDAHRPCVFLMGGRRHHR
jgi:hypothetical protein